MENSIKQPKNILVPTDLSIACENAFEHAVAQTKNSDTIIYLLHIIEDRIDLIPKEPWEEYAKNEERKRILSHLKNYIALKNVSNVVPMVREGKLFDTINKVAKEVKADTIILGTHGKKGMQKLFGSYALKVIDHTDVPVLVVQDEPNKSNEKNIIFPVSLHDEDRQKAKLAVQYAKEHNASIHVIVESPADEFEKTKAESVKRQLKSYFTKNEVNFTVRVSSFRDKEFEKDVEDYAKLVKADFIIIVSDPSTHYLLGGGKEENYLFNESRVPVLCMTSRKFKTIGAESAFTGAYY